MSCDFKSEWLSFVLLFSGRKKTDSWAVRANRGGEPLGTVQWYSPWRRYVFYPIGGLFDSRCLIDIASFIDARMAERS